MTPDQVDAFAAWLIGALHSMDPAQYQLTAEQAAARLKTLPHPVAEPPAPVQTAAPEAA